MKIQWIANNINQIGGVERVIAQLSGFFVNCGNEVEIISLCTKKTNCFFTLDPAVKVRHLSVGMKENNSRLGIIKIIHQIAKESDADIVLGCNDYICNAMVINKPFFRGRIIVTQHNAIEFLSPKRLLLESLILRFADLFVVLSEHNKQYYEKKGVKNCIVVPNAISQEFLDIHDNREKIIITAGRLSRVKGFDFLIRAFKLVHDENPEWRLRILGDGEDRDRLSGLIKELNLEDVVSLPGMTQSVITEFRKGSLFALTSHSEGFPMVLLEAMSQGLPIVSVDIPVISEILDNGTYGVLTSRNEEEFALAINAFLSDEQLLNEYGSLSLECSKAYSMEKIGTYWLELFQSLKSNA